MTTVHYRYAAVHGRHVDLTADGSVASLAERLGEVDHVISTGSARAGGFADIGARNPVRRIGTTDDVASAVLFAMTSTFLTGQTLHVDGGEPLT